MGIFCIRRGVVILTRKLITMVLIRLCIYAGWSVTLLLASNNVRFCSIEAHIDIGEGSVNLYIHTVSPEPFQQATWILLADCLSAFCWLLELFLLADWVILAGCLSLSCWLLELSLLAAWVYLPGCLNSSCWLLELFLLAAWVLAGCLNQSCRLLEIF